MRNSEGIRFVDGGSSQACSPGEGNHKGGALKEAGELAKGDKVSCKANKVSRKKHARKQTAEIMYTVYEETLSPDQNEAIEKEFVRGRVLFSSTKNSIDVSNRVMSIYTDTRNICRVPYMRITYTSE